MLRWVLLVLLLCISATGLAAGAATDAQIRAEKADAKASAAQQSASDAIKLAVEAEKKAEEVGRQSLAGGLALLFITLIALVLALRRSREQIAKGIENIAEPLSRRFTKSRPAKGKDVAMCLRGVTVSGSKINFSLKPLGLGAAQGGWVLGRNISLCDDMLKDDEVSRRHLRITLRGKELFIEDLNTVNGTTVNGYRLRPFKKLELRNEDQITLGKSTLIASLC